jgi:hypothetical protein
MVDILSQKEQSTQKYEALLEQVYIRSKSHRNPRDIRRFIQLACALEPLSEKEGLTTRSSDLNCHQKLEFFLTAGINIGDAFEDLAQRILSWGKQPDVIYDLGYEAQLDSKKNRRGGRINHGIIEMLIPIVTAQLLSDPCYVLSPHEVLKNTVNILMNTSRTDVEYLVKLKKTAYGLSGMFERPVPEYPDARTVFDYYELDRQATERYSSQVWNSEFTNGFPITERLTKAIINSHKSVFSAKVEKAYQLIRDSDHKDVVPAITADCAVCGIYLYLSHNPRDMIIT